MSVYWGSPDRREVGRKEKKDMGIQMLPKFKIASSQRLYTD